MPQSDDGRGEALDRLEDRLDAFDAERSKGKAFGATGSQAMGEGYRLLAGLIGGVLGGIGFGWLFDRFADTGPFGLIGGLLIGIGVSTYTTVRSAGRMSKTAAKDHPAAAVPFDDEDDD